MYKETARTIDCEKAAKIVRSMAYSAIKFSKIYHSGRQADFKCRITNYIKYIQNTENYQIKHNLYKIKEYLGLDSIFIKSTADSCEN